MLFCQKILPALLLLTIQLRAVAQVGNPAPNFTVTDTEGHTHQLYDYLDAGKVVVLDFFFTTCGPCQFYSPQVNLAYEKYGCNTANVVFLSIDYDDTDAQVIAYDAEYAIQYPSVSGTQGGGNNVVSLYGINSFPTFYLIDSSKTIIAQVDPPTLQVFDFKFGQHGIVPADCNASAVAETGEGRALRLFPNPAGDGRVLVELPDGGAGACLLEIFDPLGQIVRRETLPDMGSTPAAFSTEGWNAGLYLVKITRSTGGGTCFGWLVKG